MPKTTFACVRFGNDPRVHAFQELEIIIDLPFGFPINNIISLFQELLKNQHLDRNIQDFGFYYQIFSLVAVLIVSHELET